MWPLFWLWQTRWILGSVQASLAATAALPSGEASSMTIASTSTPS